MVYGASEGVTYRQPQSECNFNCQSTNRDIPRGRCDVFYTESFKCLSYKPGIALNFRDVDLLS